MDSVLHIESLLDEIEEVAIITLSRDGNLVRWNRAATGLFGFQGSEDQCLRPWHSLQAGNGQNGQKIDTWTAVHERVRKRLDLRGVDGAIFPANVTFIPLPETHGAPGGCTVLVRPLAPAATNECSCSGETGNHRYRELINNTEDLIWRVDNRGEILLSNSAFTSVVQLMSGLEALDKKNASNGFPQLLVDKWADFYARAFGGESFSIVEYTDFPTERWNEISFCPVIRDGIVAYVDCFAHDITKRKQAEDKIIRSEAKLRTIFNTSSELYVLLDVGCRVLDFNLNASKAHIQTTGAKLVTGLPIFDQVESSRAAFYQYQCGQVLNGKSARFEYSVVDSLERRHYYHMQFNPVFEGDKITGICINGRDMTDFVFAQEQVAMNEKRFRALIEFGSEGVVILDERFNPVYSSPSVVSVLGYSEREILAMDFMSISHPEDVGSMGAVMEEVLNNPGMPVKTHAIRKWHKSGAWRWYEATITNLLYEPSIRGIVDNFRDVTDRVEKEIALRKKEQQLQKIMDNSPDMICTLDEYGTVLTANNATLDILGYSPTELIGKKRSELVPPDDREQTEEMLRRVMAGKELVDREVRMVRKNGTIVYVSTSIRWSPEERALFGITRDRTEKKQLELQRVKDQKKYSDLFLLAPSRICMLQGPEHTYVMANPAYLGFLKNRTVIGKTVREVYPEVEAQGVIELLDNVYKTGIPFRSAEKLVRLDTTGDGNLKDVYLDFVYQPVFNDKHEVEGIFYFGNEVTERVLARRKVEQQERYFRTLIENIDDLIIKFDQDKIIHYVSPAVCKLTGYTADELIGSSLMNIIAPAFRIDSIEFCRKLLSHPGVRMHRSNCLLTKSGDEMWIEGTVTNLLNDVDIRGIIANLKDVTQKQLAEQKLLNANRLYAFISSIDQAIIHSFDEKTVFRQACKIAVDVGNFEMAWIARFDLENNIVNLVESYGIPESEISFFKNISFHPQGPATHILETGRHFLCNDLETEFASERWIPFFRKYGIKSMMALPIRKEWEVVGSITLFSKAYNLFDEREIDLLEEVANDISFSLDVFEKERRRNEMEEKLYKRDIQMKQAQAVAHFGSWDRDLKTGVTNWSEEAYQIYGLAPSSEHPTFEQWLSFIHPDDIAHVMAEIKAGEENGAGNGFYHRIVQPGGGIRYLYSQFHVEKDATGASVHLYGVLHDETETREAEKALAQSEANLRLILDLLPQAVFAKDALKRVVFLNEAYAEMYGKTKEELFGKEIPTFNIEPNDPNIYAAEDQRVLDTGETLHIREDRFFDYSGKLRIIEKVKVPFVLPGTDQKAVLGILNDITEQKNAEAERTRLLEEMVRRNKDLEQFSYIVSHNLRAPVANILGLAELISFSGLDGYEGQELMTELNSSVLRLDNVIKDLNYILQVKHTERMKREFVSFTGLLSDIKISIDNLIKMDDVRIEGNFSEVSGVLTIKSYLYSVFFNLISNSIKYRRHGIRPLIHIKSEVRGQKIVLTFTDNGIGIDLQKFRDQLFGLYKKFHTHMEGKGMGLYMVKTQVEALGGTISVASKLNEGTVFTIELAQEPVINHKKTEL